MRLRGSVFKDILVFGLGLVWVPGVLALLAMAWSTPTVQGFVTLHPTTLGAWALIALLVAETALAVWIAAHSLRLGMRRHPTTALRAISSRPVAGSKGFGVPGLAVSTRALHLTEIDLTLPRLPASLDGLRLVHLSDLHIEFANGTVSRALDVTAELAPDLVAVTGDFIVKRANGDFENACTRLAALDAPLGVWVIRGNHDLWYDGEAVTAALAHHGLRLLANSAADVTARGERLRLIGVEHPWTRVGDWETLLHGDGAACRIALSHSPDNFERLARAGVDLVLAGHTHGGQWRFPLVGSVIVPSNHGRRFDHGLFEDSGAAMWVTRGVGCVGVPVRINCPPEIALITLRAPAEAVATAEESAA
jgi:predicted MPP superfamily phosphohydrolase